MSKNELPRLNVNLVKVHLRKEPSGFKMNGVKIR